MKAYFIRRFLLVPVTLFGITLIAFVLTRFMPGGPIERQMQELALAGGDTQAGSGNRGGTLSDEDMEELEEEYGFDKPMMVAYLQWLGFVPRERFISKKEFIPVMEDKVGNSAIKNPKLETVVLLKGSGREVLVTRKDDKKALEAESAVFLDTKKPVSDEGWSVRIDTPEVRAEGYKRRQGTEPAGEPAFRAVLYKDRFAGMLQGDLGKSYRYQDDVSGMIMERIPIALYFGILSTIIMYAVCIPLGIVKAIKHRTFIDNATSVLIFVGYSIPGFALGAVMLTFLGARFGWFPLFGLVGPDFDELNAWEKLIQLGHHTVLPLVCYVVGGFAYTTMMMKNNLMDNLAADYVRTAVAKGVSFRRAVFKHAFRNSFIPIATSLGGIITILVSGSILIETVFDIQGFGLLQFQAITNRDYNVVMGTLTFAAFLMLIGNILSDIIVALIDPRIKFN